MLYSSIITIFQFFLQRSIGGILWWLGERTFSIGTPGIAKIALCNLIHSSCPLYLRPYATFPHPNVLGGFLGVALLLVGTIPHEDVRKLLPRGVRIQEPLLSFLQFILLGAGGVSLILTFSRSAWAMVLLAVVAIGISKRVNALKFRAILGGAIVFFAVMIFYIFSAHFSDESLIVREQLNSAAFSIIQFHPFIGVGLGNFLVALPSFIPSREVYFLQPAHNIYLLLLSQIGFFGIALLIVFAYFLILQFKKNGRSFGFKNKRSVFRICLLGLLFIGLIDHYSVTLQQGQLLLTLLISMSL